jgi:uncharacterized protein YjiS (DUF1127 family)
MTAHFANENTGFHAPAPMSHYFEDEPYAPAPERRGLFVRLGSALRRLADLRQRRAVLEELGRLTDYELKDIGLTRGELRHVFDPEFAARRAADRGAFRIGGFAGQTQAQG